jgi:hypothetical protein
MMVRSIVTVCALSSFVSIGVPDKQLLTIPELLARFGRPLSSGPTVPSGPAPSLDDVARDTDVLARGTVGESTSYLSPTSTEVYTDYVLLLPSVLYGSFDIPSLGAKSTRSIVVTIIGGQITINGLTYTSRHEALPELPKGADCLFMLKRMGDKYILARTYYGAFDLSTGKAIPLAQKRGFTTGLEQEDATVSAERISRRVAELRGTGR